MNEVHVALIGASGFLGSRILTELIARGAVVNRVAAPRLHTDARELGGMQAALLRAGATPLRSALVGADVIVNAAGVADAAAPSTAALYGANALLPGLIAASRAPTQRLVHVSSAAVQGSARLDDGRGYAPFSPYSRSKVVGEQMIADVSHTVTFRPTSVHGAERTVTRALHSILRSPLSAVAGSGNRHTPQVLVENVAAAVAEIAMRAQMPPHVVLQPSEGLTCRDLGILLGGRVPTSIPAGLARALIRSGLATGRASSRISANARRAELMWFGQQQDASWLTHCGWTPPVGHEGWLRLRHQVALRARSKEFEGG